MNLKSLIVLAGCTTFSLAASAETYPVLATYTTQGQELITLAQTANSAADVQTLAEKTKTLIASGVEIMKLYGEKNPNCHAQYDTFLAALPTMDTLPVDVVKSQFHDGAGLPAAPRHCYFGRSEIVHPVMNLIRMKQAWTDDNRQEVVADFDEVVEHIPRIQNNLDNPPN